MLFGEYVSKLRMESGISRVDLAKALGCSLSHVNQIETGAGYISEQIADDLARIFGTKENLFVLSEFEKTVFYLKQLGAVNPWAALVLVARYLVDKYYCVEYLESLKENGHFDSNMETAEHLRRLLDQIEFEKGIFNAINKS